MSVAGEHLKGREIGERDAHRFGHINAIGDRHQETRGADRVLSVAANHAEIRDQFTLARRNYAGARLIDDTHEFVSWRDRQRSLEVGVAATSNEAIGETGASGENLNSDLAGAGFGDGRLFRQF